MTENRQNSMINDVMKNLFNYIELVRKNEPDLGGVFTYADLAVICNCSDTTRLPRYIRQLEEAGTLKKFMRGFYVTQAFDPRILSQRICPESYLSFETILSKNMIIGTIPTFRISAVKLGRSKIYRSQEITVEHLATSEKTFFGFYDKGGVKEADSEKALIDTLYFYQKGRKPSFELYSDLNIVKLNQELIHQYLESYKNPKFLKFVLGVLDAYR